MSPPLSPFPKMEFETLERLMRCTAAVTKEDVRGTALIVVAVILILIFSSINHGLDGSISIER